MNQVQCTLFPLGLSRLCPHLPHQILQITTIPIIKQHDCKYNQDSWHKQSLHYLKRKFSTYNPVTLDFELSSSHTYNYILGNIRMKTIIFKKIGQHTNSY